ncbi:hypothetical protein ATO6_12895 [Oceanicola sp. 22II-s10i]|uniref:DUF1289 domain-containing protein n=1 Tax=Oceanicola sp. 22II-s10i TaxID=1317116 RepID=UPI000B5284A2|nr:DUF1289 domain-containing protein [Oceanicola sp. 22II-s10i]OWU84561.1 hypothetical protein ATO6_12895 [Oceanicola sp. 22II-s10i]
MSDEVWKRREISSPCVKICMIHPDAGLCTGCLRTRDEIALWMTYSSEERARIMAELPDRRPQLVRRRGGRAARLARGGDQ